MGLVNTTRTGLATDPQSLEKRCFVQGLHFGSDRPLGPPPPKGSVGLGAVVGVGFSPAVGAEFCSCCAIRARPVGDIDFKLENLECRFLKR